MKVLVTGATSPIGDFLLPRLIKAGYEVTAVSRSSQAADESITWVRADLDNFGALPALDNTALIHLAPIWLLHEFLETAIDKGVNRVIAVGSTSVFTKTQSVSSEEREITQLLQRGEETLKSACGYHHIPWTLFRPTMIYGSGRDQNISAIARTIESFGRFIIPGRGSGKRQPIHADDIAQACVAALERSDTCANHAYNLSGGSTLSYRQMVELIFETLGKRPRIWSLPNALVRMLVLLARLLPRFRHITLGMVQRVNRDLIFDHSKAAVDLEFRPRPFLQAGKADLGK